MGTEGRTAELLKGEKDEGMEKMERRNWEGSRNERGGGMQEEDKRLGRRRSTSSSRGAAKLQLVSIVRSSGDLLLFSDV